MIEPCEVVLHVAKLRDESVAAPVGVSTEEEEPAAETAGLPCSRFGAHEHVGLFAIGALVARAILRAADAARLQVHHLRLHGEAGLRLRARGEEGDAGEARRSFGRNGANRFPAESSEDTSS